MYAFILSYDQALLTKLRGSSTGSLDRVIWNKVRLPAGWVSAYSEQYRLAWFGQIDTQLVTINPDGALCLGVIHVVWIETSPRKSRGRFTRRYTLQNKLCASVHREFSSRRHYNHVELRIFDLVTILSDRSASGPLGTIEHRVKRLLQIGAQKSAIDGCLRFMTDETLPPIACSKGYGFRHVEKWIADRILESSGIGKNKYILCCGTTKG